MLPVRKTIVAVVMLLTTVCSLAQTSPTKTSPGQHSHGAQPQFSVETAFKRLYGNYDPNTKSAVWSDFTFPTTGEWWEQNRFICEIDPEPLRVHLLIDRQVIEGGAIKHYFVTWAVPQSWTEGSGRQCKTAIGATVFVWRGKSWEVESSNRYMASAGTYGYPPETVMLLRLGKARHGMIMETGDLTQGYYWTSVALIAPVGKDFREVWAQGVSSDNSGTCSNDAKERKEFSFEKCYASSASYRVIEVEGSEYFDIRVVSKGTSRKPKDKIVSENWTKLYRFADGRYKEVSKVDVTKKIGGR
jgi:hypothetical protein